MRRRHNKHARSAPHPIYSKLLSQAAESNPREHNDCSVYALALLTGRGYKAAHAACEKQGRVFRDGMHTGPLLRAIKSLGFDTKSVFPGKERMTIAEAPLYLDADKRYLLITSGHFAALVKGRIEDWSIGRSLVAYGVYEITRRRA